MYLATNENQEGAALDRLPIRRRWNSPGFAALNVRHILCTEAKHVNVLNLCFNVIDPKILRSLTFGIVSLKIRKETFESAGKHAPAVSGRQGQQSHS